MTASVITLEPMLSPYAPPQTDVPPSRGVLWVLRSAAALLAIAAWLVLMLHLVLILRAEFKLREVMQQASAFSELPQISQAELVSYVGRRTSGQGFAAAQIAIVSDFQNAKWRVEAIEAAPGKLIPRGIQWMAHLLGAPSRVAVSTGRASPGIFPTQE